MWIGIEEVLFFCGLYFMAYVYYKRNLPYDFEESLPPTFTRLPFVGSLLYLPRVDKMPAWFLDQLPTMGSVIGFYSRSKYGIVIQSRRALNEAFVRKATNFGSRPLLYVNKRLNPELRGITDRLSDASFKEYHQLISSILQKSNFSNSSSMEAKINVEVEDLVSKIGGLAAICPKTLIHCSVVNVIASILFGRHLLDNGGSNHVLCDLISRLNTYDMLTQASVNVFPILRFLPHIYLRLVHCVANHTLLLDILQKQIDETLSREAGSGEQSFIQSFIDAEGRDQFDRQELLYILRDMIIAGSETSTTTITWAIALLADNQDVQKKLHDEIDSVIDAPDSGSSTGKRLPSLADRAKLPYVEAAIMELMRMTTAVPMGPPHETIGDTTVKGYTIPTGTMVVQNIYAIHMNPTVWKDHTQFDSYRE